jgi:short-subunit dehydrogenase
MIVLITGASRGIGKAIASELAMAGHELLMTSRTETNLSKAASDVRLLGVPSKVNERVCDVTKKDQVDSLNQYCLSQGIYPNVLVLNAGIFLEGTLADAPLKDFRETLEVNLVAIYYFVKQFLPILRQNANSKVILIGSTAAYEAYPIGSLYGVAKWALRGYSINLRRELMKEGIGVTLVSPGGTLTDLWDGVELPKNRLLEPRDIGKLIACVLTLSPQAVVEELIVRPMLGDIHE